MNDKSLRIWLTLIFGGLGVGLLVLAWLVPALQADRITATLAGIIGLGIAVVSGRVLRQPGHGDTEKIPEKVDYRH